MNKTVKVLDSVRKDRRLQNAEREITMYRQRIASYKHVFDVSLQAAIALVLRLCVKLTLADINKLFYKKQAREQLFRLIELKI